MRILIHFSFDEAQIETFQQIAHKYGDHEVCHATSEEEALQFASETEVIWGFFCPRFVRLPRTYAGFSRTAQAWITFCFQKSSKEMM